MPRVATGDALQPAAQPSHLCGESPIQHHTLAAAHDFAVSSAAASELAVAFLQRLPAIRIEEGVLELDE